MEERLQKLIAKAGLASRRTAERWIEEGLVQVNDRSAVLGERADPLVDKIIVNGQALSAAEQK